MQQASAFHRDCWLVESHAAAVEQAALQVALDAMHRAARPRLVSSFEGALATLAGADEAARWLAGLVEGLVRPQASEVERTLPLLNMHAAACRKCPRDSAPSCR